MKISRILAALALLAMLIVLPVRTARAQNLYSGVTNVLMTGPLTNNTGNQSITFTNTQFQGIGTLYLVSSNIAGTLPTLACTLQGSWDGGTTFTNLPQTLTNSATVSFSTTNVPIASLPPILRTTNIFGGTSPQFNYTVVLQLPLRNKL